MDSMAVSEMNCSALTELAQEKNQNIVIFVDNAQE